MSRHLLFALSLSLGCAGLSRAKEIAPTQNHEVWTAATGFPGGYVYSISQTNDGYLWIGSSKGLIRYDGLGFLPIRETDRQTAADFPVLGLARDSAGQLWAVDDVTHLFRYMDGRLAGPQPDSGLHRHRLAAIATNRQGALLFASELQGIVEYEHGKRRVVLDAGAMPGWPTAVAQTADGTYWVGTRDAGVFRVNADGGGRIEPVAGIPDEKINCMLPLGDSTLLVGTNKGLTTLHDGVIEQTNPELNGRDMLALAGGQGEVWIGANDRLFRADANEIARTGKIQSLDQVEVRSPVTALFEDRDGNLWIGGPDTIERYRGDGFSTYSTAAGLPCSNCGAIYAGESGDLWFAPWDGGLFRLSKGSVEQITAGGLSDASVYSISGSGGEIWVARKYGGVTRIESRDGVSEARTYRQRDGLAQDSVYSIYQARDGAVWAGTLDGGVSVLRDNTWRTFTTQDGLPSNSISVVTGNAAGEIFVGTPNGLAEFGKNGWVTFTPRDGLPPGAVESLFSDREGTLWIGTAKGISFLQADAIHVPLGAPDPLYGEILGIAESGGWLWISTRDHVLRVKRADVLKSAFEAGDYREFTPADGLASVEGVRRSRSVVEDNHGRIWFSLHQGISVLQPSAFFHPAFPVTIRLDGLTIDGKPIPPRNGVRVAPGPHRLTFRYAGVNVSNPEDVRYRYRLENVDRGWSEPTAVTEAGYTNVPPGRFTFHVQACNSDGVWNGVEAAMTGEIDPAFWQNHTYQAISVVGLLLLAWGFYRRRLGQMTARADLRYAERLAERSRIARELHDTLLQSFQGVLFKFSAIHYLIRAQPEEAEQALQRTMEQARAAITEGRDAVQGLRASTIVSNDLTRAISTFAQGIAADHAGPDCPEFRIEVVGKSRDFPPLVRDEVYQIACESLRNAFRHAEARWIEVHIRYDPRRFRLHIVDNGKGIDPAVLSAGGLAGHHGLPGIHERAQIAGGKLSIWSQHGSGTEIELTIPAAIAYLKSTPVRGPTFPGTGGE